jgi:D-alanyl-D-alanine-carboxypeptidase/D-alanyl-D-alanine-endopeptidase
MLKKPKFLFILLLASFPFFLHCGDGDAPTGPQFETLDEEIGHIVEQYYDVSCVVGIINMQQEELDYYYGSTELDKNLLPNRNTIYQIGSITKTFTGTLLAQMVLDGKVNLDDRVMDYLPTDEVTMPTYKGIGISFKHLATHSSGIPKKPHDTDFPYPPGYDHKDAYRDYKTEHIYDFLTNYCTLKAEPGSGYLYSNIGVGLLGHTLGRIDKTTYEMLLENTLLTRLKMNNSALFVDNSDTNLAMGYSTAFETRPKFDAHDIFQGAGFLKSSLHDMMIYLKANLGLYNSIYDNAFSLAHQTHFEVGDVSYSNRPGVRYDLSIGLCWHKHITSDGRKYFWHGGRTNGHSAYIGFDKENQIGVVVLCNYEDVEVVNLGDKIMEAIYKY